MRAAPPTESCVSTSPPSSGSVLQPPLCCSRLEMRFFSPVGGKRQQPHLSPKILTFMIFAQNYLRLWTNGRTEHEECRRSGGGLHSAQPENPWENTWSGIRQTSCDTFWTLTFKFRPFSPPWPSPDTKCSPISAFYWFLCRFDTCWFPDTADSIWKCWSTFFSFQLESLKAAVAISSVFVFVEADSLPLLPELLIS